MRQHVTSRFAALVIGVAVALTATAIWAAIPSFRAASVRLTGAASAGTAGTAANPVLWADTTTRPNIRVGDGTADQYVPACSPTTNGDICSWNGTNWVRSAGASVSWPLTNGTSTNTYNSVVTDGASAVGHQFYTTNTFATDGDKVAVFQSPSGTDWVSFGRVNGSRKFTFSGDADASGNGPLLIKSASSSAGLTLDASSAGGRIYQTYSTASGLLVIADLTASANRWQMDANGALAPFSQNTVNLGLPGTNEMAAVYSVKGFYSGVLNVASQAAPGSPATGDIWTDSTQLALTSRQDGISQKLEGVMFTGTASTTVSTATTATVVGTGVGTLTLPANFCAVGKTIRAHVGGVMTTSGTPGNYTFFFKLGATTVATTGTFTPQASATTKGWEMDAIIVFRSCGSPGSVMVDGQATYPSAAGARGVQDLNNNGSATSVTTTGSLLLDAQVTLGSASQTVVGTTSSWEVMN